VRDGGREKEEEKEKEREREIEEVGEGRPRNERGETFRIKGLSE
jgi:hypothetical protein